ncbi:hypothetical protein [Microcystis aeruginosa]|uniref:hypothetical protein n=1 Tax=Microcystis aeruginosa TaxID=1126 RepID=UPI002330D9F5|nr:hypothetical protein [Microcystis aeruginosa]MDB9418845.1 hypothetical protein [Microcystis aeruginosa CS-556/03]
MIHSEILQEKDKTQTRLSEECTSIHDYLVKSRIDAEKAAESYGFTLKYAEEIHKIREEHTKAFNANTTAS